jgi:3-oxoacyl-[acyl-carrier protein] reductase
MPPIPLTALRQSYASSFFQIRPFGLTRTMAKEWGRYNVNVNCIGFGIIETRLTAPFSEQGAPTIDVAGRKIPVGAPPKVIDAVRAACPLGRTGTVEEAAAAVLFFCSPLSDYVTGEVLICGGGLQF